MTQTNRAVTASLTAATILAAVTTRSAAQAPLPSNMHVPAPLGSCTSYSALTPEEIWKSGNSPEAWKKFENECVRWKLPLKTVRAMGTSALVYLGAGSGEQTVAVVATSGDLPRLKAVKPDDKIEVQGRITWVRADRIALHQTTLEYPKTDGK